MNRDDALELLHKYADSEESYNGVLAHSETVCEIALELACKANDNGHEIDLDFIESAALLHDIGRFVHPPQDPESIRHGVAGEEILAQEGLPEHAHVASHHTGAGITIEDIKLQNLPLPEQDFIPETVEEKIIAYADNLAFNTRRVTIIEVIDRFKKRIGEEYVQRIIAQHNEVMDIIGEAHNKIISS